jgi:phospholipid/cholesterol/gamma-HCH transport system substrate-binding protein
MDERKLRLGVGVLVVASIGIGIGLTMFFGAFRTLLTKHYTITARFPSAPGVGFDTPVKKNGVQVGRVKDIRLLNTTPGGVLLTMEIEEQHSLRADEIPVISTGSLITGDAVVEFVPANDQQLIRLFDGRAETDTGAPIPPNNRLDAEETFLANRPLEDGYYVDAGEVKGDPFAVIAGLEGDMRETLEAVRKAGQSVDTLALSVRTFVDGNQLPLRDIAAKTEATLTEFQGALVDLRSIIGDPELKSLLGQSLGRVPLVLDDAQRTLQNAQRAFESFERVGQAAERTVENVEQFTDPLAERGGELVDSVLKNLQNLELALVQVSTFGQQLNSGNGTIRRLIEDEDLYWQIRRVIDNAEDASVKIRPILDDVRIFSDKISRDPRQLGIRGALDSRGSGLGLK